MCCDHLCATGRYSEEAAACRGISRTLSGGRARGQPKRRPGVSLELGGAALGVRVAQRVRLS